MKAAKRPPILQSSIAALVALLVCSPAPAKAQVTLTWTGAASNLWENNGNWNPAGTPGTAAVPANLIFTGSVNTTSDNNNAGGVFVQNITFDQNAAAFNLFDQPVFLNGNSAIINNSRFTQVISFGDQGFGGIGLFDFGGSTHTITAATAPIIINSNIGFDAPVILTLNGASNITINGVIFDSGAPPNMSQLVVAGPGIVTLTAQNTYPGTTTVTGGTLNLLGSIASKQTIIMFGGTLTGTGVVGGNLTNSGNVAPGDAPGVLTVKGNYQQTRTGTLTIALNGNKTGQYSALAVGGQAALAGDLRLVSVGNSPRLSVGQKVTILTAADGVQGKFSRVDALALEKVIYKANSVAVEMASFGSIANLTPNEIAVAGGLDKVAFRGTVPKLIGYLESQPLSQLPGDYDKISPDQLTSIFTIGVSLANVQTMNLERRTDDIRSGSHGFSASGFATAGNGPLYSGDLGLAGPSGDDGKESKDMKSVAPAEDRWGAFITGVGEWVNVSGDGNGRGYDVTTGGFTLGADYKVTPNFAVGISAGYAGTGADLANGGRVFVNGGKLGLYSTYFTGGFYVDTAVNGGYNSYDTRRESIQGTARGDTDGGELNTLINTGYDFKVGGFTIGPTASFQYTYLGIGDFTENGSLAPLSFPSQHQDSLRTALGFKASYDWKIGGIVIKPELRAAWQHEFGDDSYTMESSLDNNPGSLFNVNGPRIGRDSLLLGAGFAILWNERTSTYVYYDGELGRENYDSNAVSGGIRISF